MTASPPSDVVHLVDDETPVRDALEFLFASHDLPVRSYANGQLFLDSLNSAPALSGCIVLDVRMEPISGLQVHDALMARGIRVPVIFLTGHGDIPMAVDALKKGAFDFVEKPAGDAALVQRVRDALSADALRRAHLAEGDMLGAKLSELTTRERQVMQRVAAGKLNKVIADDLNVSVRSVEVYRARVYAKLGVRSAAEVATFLAKSGD